MTTLSRRDFIKASMLGFGATTIALSLSGCSSDKSEFASNDFAISFDHGVASGDPLNNGIILWTRVTPEGTPDGVNLTLQIASDDKFKTQVIAEEVVALASNDYTVKVDFSGLNPSSRYYFRFITSDKTSPVGQFKTLPQYNVSQVKFAVVSCANYPAGYFHAYAEAAKLNDLDAVIHLGDYIYEYGMDGYATEDAAALGRELASDNQNEILTLTDYRKRYATYRRDSGLQMLHAKNAFICVWDDHEVANDAYVDGAENHNTDEGDYQARKLAALQAYFEWMPIRPMVKDQLEQLYRRFEFGELVSLHMLDTRHTARAKALEYSDYIDPMTGQMNQAQLYADLTAPSQTLLGQSQLMWLQDGMQTSSAKWQVLGQQVVMGQMTIPAELLMELANPSAAMQQKLVELAQIKGRLLKGDPSLTAMEKARVTTVAPYNLDAWDGYPVEREVILQTAKALGKNLVVLAGDTHNAWANKLLDSTGVLCGYEFATSSVSSPGLLVDNLEYANIHQRGFMTVTFTQANVTSQWHYVSTVKAKEYTVMTQQEQKPALV
jgi:alkaline phosphatase D